MGSHKIDMQILSYTSPVSEHVPVSEAVKICKRANIRYKSCKAKLVPLSTSMDNTRHFIELPLYVPNS